MLQCNMLFHWSRYDFVRSLILNEDYLCSSLCERNCLILCNHLNVCELAYTSSNFTLLISLCTIGVVCFGFCSSQY